MFFVLFYLFINYLLIDDTDVVVVKDEREDPSLEDNFALQTIALLTAAGAKTKGRKSDKYKKSTANHNNKTDNKKKKAARRPEVGITIHVEDF